MTLQNVLYGSHASYYTAKTRAYLRKKGIPFVERLPSAARFREHVRPTSGSHRIPQLELADGRILQDSTEIFDVLEPLYPELPALPTTPRQRLVAHLFELFASEGLVMLAWQYRWAFEENDRFSRMDFGRWFRPQGSDDELLRYGGLIAGLLSAEDDQPMLEGGCQGHWVWLAQRALFFYDGLSGEDRAACDSLMARCGGSADVETQPLRRIERRDNRLAVASR